MSSGRALSSWMEKCPVCYTGKRVGHDVDVYHKLEMCKVGKRDLVATEIAKLQEIEFANGVCCKLCAVPRETCYDSMDVRGQGKEKCL